MDYEHGGVKIKFTEQTGEFSAHVAGKFIKAPSLAAIRKRIDSSKTFAPFEALVEKGGWHAEGYEVVTIVSISRPKGKNTWRNEPKWIDSKGREYREVATNSPENLVALQKYDALVEKNQVDLRVFKDQQDAAEAAAKSKIHILIAKDAT